MRRSPASLDVCLYPSSTTCFFTQAKVSSGPADVRPLIGLENVVRPQPATAKAPKSNAQLRIRSTPKVSEWEIYTDERRSCSCCGQKNDGLPEGRPSVTRAVRCLE